MTIMMVIPLFAVLPVEVSAAGNPVVFDASNYDTKLKWIEPTANALVGNYELDETENAISLNYHNSTAANADWGSRVKFPLQMKNAQHGLTDQYYMVVTYKTNLTGGSLRIGNFGTKPEDSKPDTFLELASNVGVSGGEYVHTAPINTNTGKTNFFERLTKSNVLKEMLLFVYNPTESEYSGKYFYIKEIAFFSSVEQANEYYPPAPELPTVIDFSSKESAEEFLAVPADSGKNDVNGVFSFDAEEGALSLEYSTLTGSLAGFGSYVKYNMDMKSSSVIGDEDKYIVVTYKTNMSGSSLALNNLQGAGTNVTLAENVGVSGGRYVRTEPINIDRYTGSDPTKVTTNFFERWNQDKGGNLLCVVNPEKDKYFYVKEIAFFKSEEAAKAWYPDPVVVDMSSAEAAEELLAIQPFTDDGINGESEFDETEGALSIKYSTSSGESAEYGSRVKFQIKMNAAGLLTERHQYMVVTYKTDMTSGALMLNNLRNGNKNLTLAEDVSISDGEYVHTEPICVNAATDDGSDPLNNYFKRWSENKGGNLLFVSNPESGKQFYVKQIAFFSNELEAKEYCAIWDELNAEVDAEESLKAINSGVMMMLLKKKTGDSQNSEKAKAPKIKGKHTIASMESAKIASEKLTIVEFTDNGINGASEFDADEGALAVRYSDSTGASAEYGSRIKFQIKMKHQGVLEGKQQYMVITYKTDMSGALKLNNLRDGKKHLILAEDVSVSNGEYVRTAPVDLNTATDDGSNTLNNYFERLTTHNQGVLLFVDSKETDKILYIKEIAFFAKLEEAQAYYEAGK